jgi:hypothetical protein
MMSFTSSFSLATPKSQSVARCCGSLSSTILLSSTTLLMVLPVSLLACLVRAGIRWFRDGPWFVCWGPLSRFPLALSPKTKRTRSYTSYASTHVTSGVNTRQTPSNLTGIRTMETTAWRLDALSSRDRRGSGRRGLSRRSGRVDI